MNRRAVPVWMGLAAAGGGLGVAAPAVAQPLERPEDPYVAPAHPARTSVPAVGGAGALRGTTPVRLHRQVNVTPGGMNIVGDAANEPSIAVDPTAPNRMAIGWRQFDTVASNFRQAGYGYSVDGGRTWTAGVIQPGLFRSDPVLRSDRDGVFSYLSLRSGAGFLCDVFHSVDGGRTWGPPIFAQGGDKAWMAIDATGGPGDGNIYQAWSTCCAPNASTTFARSVDDGGSFLPPQAIPTPPIWGTLDVGPDGELYIIGNALGGIRVAKAPMPWVQPPTLVGFPQSVVVNMGGSGPQAFIANSPNPGGLLGHAQVVVDKGDGPRRGHVYALCSLAPPAGDPLDLMFARSTDGGVTWSPPVRINDDAPGGWQWFGTMSVAPNGRIDVIWNDTRTVSPRRSRLYYSFSTDGGQTWSPNTPLTEQWDSWVGWPNQNKIGDYYDLVSDNVGAHLAWSATFNEGPTGAGEQDVYYMRIGDYDCNGNSVGDAEDVVDGVSIDCNRNGIPDECEIAAGAAEDADGDGRIDACACTADWNTDGAVDSLDISAFLTSWLASVQGGTLEADFDASGAVNSNDISAFLTTWLEAVGGPPC